MDIFLSKVTQNITNYAIRTGIGITASFAINQTSRLLKTVDNNADREQLRALQERLNSKIRIISPAIDMIELISARGSTTLESAVALTKTIRWDIQALGTRLEKAAIAEELSRKSRNTSASRAAHELEIRRIMIDIQKLLTRIEDAVPLMNLAITTSGASLSTRLPPSVSPSRLLQASTFLTAGDTQYSMDPSGPVQVGPTFYLSIYMLYAGHIHRAGSETESMRDLTWKEAIHKARVQLLRVPLQDIEENENTSSYTINSDGTRTPLIESIESMGRTSISGEGNAREFAYILDIVEDLNDDRVHSFEENEMQPGPYKDVALAGIRENLPIHQISRVFYADTGKLLNIGGQGETNNPVLLIKRDVNAPPPRRMMQNNERTEEYQYDEPEDFADSSGEVEESQDDIDQQLRRESSVNLSNRHINEAEEQAWKFPADLDTEWIALEVYTEAEDSDSEDGLDTHDDSAYASHRPSSSSGASLAAEFTELNLQSSPGTLPASSPNRPFQSQAPSPFGPIRSSLSLLEMLFRLTALQQFKQASHLAIPDEYLIFFLEESSTTGAGGDGDERRRTRRDARHKVGFDPYDESPIKRRGEDYQYQGQDHDGYRSRSGTPFQGQDQENYRSRSGTPYDENYSPRSPEPWLRNKDVSLPQTSASPSSPITPHRVRPGPLDRVRQERGLPKVSSPLGRGVSLETDSTLGTSPGSPTLPNRKDKV